MLERWAAGDAYEAYVGRWSRRVAAEFVARLGVAPGARWLDVGCGTGALAGAVVAGAGPAAVLGLDPSTDFLRAAVAGNPGVAFAAADARSLPLADGGVDAVVSGLALNFVPGPDRAAAEFARVVAPGGVVAAYVWDYAEGMEFMRHFWDAAAELDGTARSLDEGTRFPLCRPDPLRRSLLDAGLVGVDVDELVVPTVFADFDDYWTPFLGGQGPAPGYAMSLSEDRRSALRDALRSRLPAEADGSIHLTARAWAVRGRRAG
jgi:SAM-dependent methyltransferase